jgi:hypothetical protein
MTSTLRLAAPTTSWLKFQLKKSTFTGYPFSLLEQDPTLWKLQQDASIALNQRNCRLFISTAQDLTYALNPRIHLHMGMFRRIFDKMCYVKKSIMTAKASATTVLGECPTFLTKDTVHDPTQINSEHLHLSGIITSLLFPKCLVVFVDYHHSRALPTDLIYSAWRSSGHPIHSELYKNLSLEPLLAKIAREDLVVVLLMCGVDHLLGNKTEPIWHDVHTTLQSQHHFLVMSSSRPISI